MTDASPTLYVDRLVFVVCIVCAAFAAGLWIGDANHEVKAPAPSAEFQFNHSSFLRFQRPA